MSASFSCFFHPQGGRNFKSLDERCPDCEKPFGWPLQSKPAVIAGMPVLEAKNRGFYGAAYIVTNGMFQQRGIMKIVPVNSYQAFKKDWLKEVSAQHELANQNQPHFARIFNAGTDDVTFADGTVVRCHWALMDEVPGRTLDVFMKEEGRNVTAIAQIALDLLEILRVLDAKQKIHNDLHAGNIIVTDLPEGDRRAGAVDDSIRAVAIDYGSLGDSVVPDGRPTDRQRVGEILRDFTSELLREDPSKVDSRSYRLASELTRLRDIFLPDQVAQRIPTYDELKDAIRVAARYATGAEWDAGANLSMPAEGYNAQTLKPSAVARLLFDDKKWTDEIAGGGAQIVLGMRGCGKTMLLRSLDFHARAAFAAMNGASDSVKKVEKDGFLGLYVSAVRLLDARRDRTIDFRPILFAAFAREAAQVVMHLENLRSDIDRQSSRVIGEVVQTYMKDLTLPIAASASTLDKALQKTIFALASGEEQHPLKTSATAAFIDLARAISTISGGWGTPRILYLLDDVSTRYLDEELIRDVLSQVLFQNETCAFKVTTETQTLVGILRSPGGIEALRDGRDYRQFNLGERVTQRLKEEGWRFIDNLLNQRLNATERYPELRGLLPSQIVGTKRLEDIAATIAATDGTASERQSVYVGIEALAAMCVGDIGDTIALFDRMIERAKDGVVSAKDQTAVYKQLCGQRLWELASKDVALKDQALGFAEAAHELLKTSKQKKASGKSRLRQYTKVYVRDIDEESFLRIRQLIDAGVFAMEGGIPRTKTKDADPITHFVLAFRKVLGVNSWIGLSDRDRFELSGNKTKEWLGQPSRSKDVLIRNQDTKHVFNDDQEENVRLAGDEIVKITPSARSAPIQPTIFAAVRQSEPKGMLREAALPSIDVETLQELPTRFDVVCSALGFEERARISTERVVAATMAKRILAIRYPSDLEDSGIKQLFGPWKAKVTDVTSASEFDAIDVGQDVLVDITGMNTTYIWASVQAALRSSGHVWIAYTRADRYWPSEAEINAVIGGVSDDVPADSRQLNKLRSLVSGDEGEYERVPLLGTRDDIMRPLCLFAVSSAKMRRLEHLLKSRAFDRLEIIAAEGDAARARLSQIAGRAAAIDIAAGPLHSARPTDLVGNMLLLQRLYQSMFVDAGMDIALGLTGSKLQSVAMAVLSMRVKIAEAWYIQPSQYVTGRFTRGAGRTTFFRISLT